MIDYLKCDLDDIVFEHRNRAYGSYALRKAYGKNMKRAAIGGVAVFLLLISSPLIADKLKPKNVLLIEKSVTMIDAPKEELKKPEVPPPPPPLPPPPPKRIETIRFVPPVVTHEAETEPPVITPPKPDVNIGTENVEGEKATTYTPPVAPSLPPPPPPEGPKNEKPVESDIPFVIVEQNPEFPDGVKAMYKFLADNIKYPAIARESSVEGTVYVGFVVGKDGTIRDVVVKRGIGAGCNEEAVRVVNLMPKWKSGRQQGRPVSVAYTIPIKFKLE